MARLATAAAGLAWAAILLMCAALVAGQGADVESSFPKGSLPPPVRIYCRQDPALNVAVRGGNKWHMLPTSPSAAAGPGPMPFSLMNARTGQVITIPSGSKQVGLSSRSDAARAGGLQELWMAEKPTRADGFYRLFVNKDKRFTLNGLQRQGRVHDGSLVRISLHRQLQGTPYGRSLHTRSASPDGWPWIHACSRMRRPPFFAYEFAEECISHYSLI
ncbi:hypothetical protein SETIT_6G165000v2 [Setaria italica]|uniref:Uncharacterized protein n=1 Tax=Setaria italica TaxID=4555 RepID=A0A368RMA5_SETIT|nr:hypothetical protein SETIT_6G165000v2 [Setaria italica]